MKAARNCAWTKGSVAGFLPGNWVQAVLPPWATCGTSMPSPGRELLVGFSPILEGALRRPSTPLYGLLATRVPPENHTKVSQGRGQKSAAPRGSSQAEKEENQSFLRLGSPGPPAIQFAPLLGALLDCGRRFESNMHILMSGEELVSQNSLKCDHM